MSYRITYMSQFILESARTEYITRDTELGQSQESSLPDLIWTPSHLIQVDTELGRAHLLTAGACPKLVKGITRWKPRFCFESVILTRP